MGCALRSCHPTFHRRQRAVKRSSPATDDDIVATVKRYAPDNIVRIEGHASREREVDEARNRKLSEERARTVAEAFTRSGFRSDRIFAQGIGSTKPLATNDTEQGRSQNRRVEITVKK